MHKRNFDLKNYNIFVSGHFLVKINKVGTEGRLIRKRCMGCYNSLRKSGLPSRDAGRLSRRVSTVCQECNKPYCYRCFTELHRKTR